jgi:uncharacterized protein YeaO (DUF488 family)
MAPTIHLKRAYDPPALEDGRRILVDRLWPRGVSKSAAHLDAWMKDVAPSPELRRWFAHQPARWSEFHARYLDELKANPAVEPLRRLVAEGPVTLIFGARDRAHNDAVVLAEFLKRGG